MLIFHRVVVIILQILLVILKTLVTTRTSCYTVSLPLQNVVDIIKLAQINLQDYGSLQMGRMLLVE